jgi:hypothetical protein
MASVKLEYYAPGVQKVVKKSRGFGDTIEKFTTKTGIKAVVDKISEVTGVDCGCQARRDKLNELIPYK